MDGFHLKAGHLSCKMEAVPRKIDLRGNLDAQSSLRVYLHPRETSENNDSGLSLGEFIE